MRRCARHRLRAHAVGRSQAAAGGSRRPQSHPQRGARSNARALWRRRAAAARSDRGVLARRVAGLERRARPADLRRLERARVSAGHEGFAAVARVAAPARRARRRVPAAPSLARLGSGGAPVFAAPQGEIAVAYEATVLALGGGSWPRLGSDGAWVDLLSAVGVASTPLRPANCGFLVSWSEVFRVRFEGAPLKRIALTFGGRQRAWRGDHHPRRPRGRRHLRIVGAVA